MNVTAKFPQGRLEWRLLLQWLLDDGLVGHDEAEGIRSRLGAGDSSQHPLIRLGRANLSDARNGRALDTEALTKWLACRLAMPYLYIDPLKADVAHVADVMSIRYAERRRALPVEVGLTEVTVATCEPLDTGWVAEVEAHTKKRLRLVLSHPSRVQRFTTEFYTLAHSVRQAAKNGSTAALASFEQLVDLGKTTNNLDANDQGVVQVVDWLWQYAFD